MQYFTEVTFYDEPNDREYYATAEEAAEAYAEAVTAAAEQGRHFGDWAQIRRGTETSNGRKITHRTTNEANA
jgi:hypothetical protein